MAQNTPRPDATSGKGPDASGRSPDDKASHTAQDDLVDLGSEESFPASDPPSYMGGAAITGAPPHHGEPAREGVSRELVNSDKAKPAEEAPQDTDPARVDKAPSQPPGPGGNKS